MISPPARLARDGGRSGGRRDAAVRTTADAGSMAEGEEVGGFEVSKARGDGVTVQVYEAELEQSVGQRQEVVTRAAGTWADLDALAAEFNIPREHWSIDTKALETLGPDPGSS